VRLPFTLYEYFFDPVSQPNPTVQIRPSKSDRPELVGGKMEQLDKEDVVWLNVVEYFAQGNEDVFLARHILSMRDHYSYRKQARSFSEHHLVATTGWTEYVIRRILGHWQKMGMANSKPAPTKPVVVSQIRFGSGHLSSNKLLTSRRKHTGLTFKLAIENVPLDKNRVERCAQQWEVDTNLFYNSLHARICWLRCASHQTYNRLICGCAVTDPSQHVPNEACTALICQLCEKEVTEEDVVTGFNLADTPLHDAYTITIGGNFTPWRLPVMPESLRLRRTADVPVEAEEEAEEEVEEEAEEEDEWEDAEDLWEEDEEVEVSVRGVLKKWSDLSEEDLQLMTDEEYEIYAKLCHED